MLTPRGGVSPRKSPLVGGGAAGPERGEESKVRIDLQEYQRKRFEGLSQHGFLNQDVIQTILSTLKNATVSGQTRARVQTLHLAKDYSYSRHQPPDKDALVIHDMYTFQPFAGTSTRIRLASRARELLEWLIGEQKVCVIAATCCMSTDRVFGEPTFASFMHLYAIFVPEKPSVPPSVWNAAFVKNLTAVPAWEERVVAGLRTGASHVTLCVLYKGAQYAALLPGDSGGDGGGEHKELVCAEPRHYLSLIPLEKSPKWVLDAKCATLVSWVLQTGYQWTLGMEVYTLAAAEEKGTTTTTYSYWANFIVLLQALQCFK